MIKPVTVVMIFVAPLVTLLSACGSDESASNQQTTSTSTSAPAKPAPGTERLTTQLKTADGKPVANATFEFANGYATVSVETVAPGILRPGFHGMHIHTVGKCEANSVAPAGGEPSDFNSAGGHYQAPGHTGQPASGDLTSLEVRSDGSAKLITTTNAFTAIDLRGAEGSALIIHEDPDNFGNIPPRYTLNGAPGPDQETLATGDSGKRVACGVIAPASTTSTSTSTSTSTVTTTASPSPTTGATATVPSPAPSTVTNTATVTVPTVTVSPPEAPNPSPIPNAPNVPNAPGNPGPGNPQGPGG